MSHGLMGMFHPLHVSAEKEKRLKSQSINKLIIVMVTQLITDDNDAVGTNVVSFT